MSGVFDPSELGTGARQGRRAEIGEIARDINGPDAGRGARGFDILDAEFRMALGTAQKDRPELGAFDRVGGIIAAAADQADVLDALDGLTHSEFRRLHLASIPRKRPVSFVTPHGELTTLLIEFPVATKPPAIRAGPATPEPASSEKGPALLIGAAV